MKKILIALMLIGLAGCEQVKNKPTGQKKQLLEKTQLIAMKNGSIFFCKWGAYSEIRKYKVVDQNNNGYFVTWLVADFYQTNEIEFMPKNIVSQLEFKILHN